MKAVLRSLPAKIALALVIPLILNSALFVASAVLATRSHLQAIEQGLNRDLAVRILAEGLPSGIGNGGQPLAGVFDRLMGLNPVIELYRLDREGRILDFSAPAGRVVRDRVDLKPILEFLNTPGDGPILGDDPRSEDGGKVFSAAEISDRGRTEGYLYVILGGETYQSVARMLENDYVMRLSFALAGGSLLLTAAIGLVAFRLLTRRFRLLTDEMRSFAGAELAADSAIGDEIDQAHTVFRRMRQLIREQIARLEHADQSRREMIANISHDLRTPLATLRGFLETMLIKEAEIDGPQRRRYLELASGYAVRLSGRITELFELSTLEAPGFVIRSEAFSLAELAQDLGEKMALMASRRGIRFRTEISRDTPFVAGDIGLIERALEKILENALRFTPAGGSVKLTVQGRGLATVRVDDSGPGLDPQDIPQLFNRFYRGRRGGRESGAGAGLGLAIARRIVELHGGDIGAENRDGGASFFVALPSAPPAGTEL